LVVVKNICGCFPAFAVFPDAFAAFMQHPFHGLTGVTLFFGLPVQIRYEVLMVITFHLTPPQYQG
jgi:hypothetical protein